MLYPCTRLNASPDSGNRNILRLRRDAVVVVDGDDDDDDGGDNDDDDDDDTITENCKAVKV
jgi:hypothetical protein